MHNSIQAKHKVLFQSFITGLLLLTKRLG